MKTNIPKREAKRLALAYGRYVRFVTTNESAGRIADAMREHDRHETPGSESDQWYAFVADACSTIGLDPFDDEANKTIVSHSFAAFWLAVAEYDYDLAEQYGDVPDEWRS